MVKISIIIPTLNEEKGIGKTLEQIPVKELKDLEIVIVDGDSKDKTQEIAKNKGARIIVEKRRGYGRAYKTGFNTAKGEIFITLDGDGTYPAEEIPRLVNLLEKGELDFITTNRFAYIEKGVMSFRNKLGNSILSITSNTLFGANFKDSQSGMWIFKKNAWDQIKERVKSDGMAFSQEIKIEAWRKLKCREVPIEYRKREGEVKLNAWGDGIGNLKALFEKKLKG